MLAAVAAYDRIAKIAAVIYSTNKKLLVFGIPLHTILSLFIFLM
jgi:hypothetical protein